MKPNHTRWSAGIITAALLVASAHAQVPISDFSAPWVVTAVVVGTGSTQVLPARTRKHLAIYNQSKTELVACRLDSFSSAGRPNGDVADLSGPGSVLVPPISGYQFATAPAPSNAVNCVATAAGVSFTVME